MERFLATECPTYIREAMERPTYILERDDF